MSDLYDSLALHYDDIFPLDPALVRSVEFRFPLKEKRPSILDLGCATGSLVEALRSLGAEAVGIDLSPSLLALARSKRPATAAFLREGDMRDCPRLFPLASFDLALCYGNTIAHLPSATDLEVFFRSVRSVLKPEGSFLVQILNYDRAKETGAFSFPALETPRLRFRRSQSIQADGSVLFHTELELLDENRVLTDETRLSPWSARNLCDAAVKAGFPSVVSWGSYDRRPPATEDFFRIYEFS